MGMNVVQPLHSSLRDDDQPSLTELEIAANVVRIQLRGDGGVLRPDNSDYEKSYNDISASREKEQEGGIDVNLKTASTASLTYPTVALEDKPNITPQQDKPFGIFG